MKSLFKKITRSSHHQERIRQHSKDRSEDNPRDFIDVYLQEMTKSQLNSSDNSSFHGILYNWCCGINRIIIHYGLTDLCYVENQLIGIIIDLFIAGAETTSGSIGFAILYMLHNPEIQRRIQMELDQICGDSLPQLSQRPRWLPYIIIYWRILNLNLFFTSFHFPITVYHTQKPHWWKPNVWVTSLH